jgi:hypothetical protein
MAKPKKERSKGKALTSVRTWDDSSSEDEPPRTRSHRSSSCLSAFRPQWVPGPTSKLSLRVPAQMGRRETEHKGGKLVRGNNGLVLSCARADALAVGGYKRSRGREREGVRLRVSPFSHAATFRTRALDLPFIDVRRGSRCTTGGVVVC